MPPRARGVPRLLSVQARALGSSISRRPSGFSSSGLFPRQGQLAAQRDDGGPARGAGGGPGAGGTSGSLADSAADRRERSRGGRAQAPWTSALPPRRLTGSVDLRCRRITKSGSGGPLPTRCKERGASAYCPMAVPGDGARGAGDGAGGGMTQAELRFSFRRLHNVLWGLSTTMRAISNR